VKSVVSSLQNILNNVFGMYLTAHVAHWNVTGADFHQYHDFFSDIYEDVFGSIDPLAENIRKLGELVSSPVCPNIKLSSNSVEMIKELLALNAEVENSYIKAIKLVIADPELQSLVNFLSDRLDNHQKWSWQMKSTLGLKESFRYNGGGVAVKAYLKTRSNMV
jgi:starvation-inducible DNA-binding protein